MFTNEQVNELISLFRRIADRIDPPPPDIVGTEYVASRRGVTATWVAEMVRKSEIPAICLVPGSGNGKPWKFYRRRIDEWLLTATKT